MSAAHTRRRQTRRVNRLALTILVCACGGASSSTRLAGLFDNDRAAGARQTSPASYQRAEEARDRALFAEAHDDDAAAADHATASRLWLAAAMADSETEALRSEAATFDAEATAAERLAAEREAMRERIVENAARTRAAAVARTEATRTFEHAQGYEARRLRRDDPETRQLWRQTTRALLRRATLLLAAAEQLGAPRDRLQELRTRRDQLAAQTRAELLIADANTLVADAQALLGRARLAAAAEGPTDAERQALREAAESRGYSVERTERGLELSAAGFARPTDTALTQLSGVLRAHPRGPVLIVGTAPRQATAAAAAGALRDRLVNAGVPADRISAVGVASTASRAVFVALPAY